MRSATYTSESNGAAIPAFEYVTKGAAVPGASRLVSLPYLGFARIRAYRDRSGFAWFVMTDVFKALGSGNPSNMRKRVKCADDIAKVRAWVVNTVNPEASGYHMLQALSEGGMHVMLGISEQQPSIDLRKWMTQTALPLLRTV